ncbi:hypothetical protein C8R42DRAFT_722350 [Lentinula raphanica]|nr:hypothetical protein C8R42DRAFT_722350 [Lentinula raphanica]
MYLPGDEAPTAPPSPLPVHRQGILRRHDTLFYQQQPMENVATSHEVLKDHDAPTAPPSPLPVYGKGILHRHDTLFFQLELKENVVMIHGQGQDGLLEELEFDDNTIVLENFNSTGNIPEGLSQEHVAEQPMILNLKGVPEFLAEAFGGSTNVLS